MRNLWGQPGWEGKGKGSMSDSEDMANPLPSPWLSASPVQPSGARRWHRFPRVLLCNLFTLGFAPVRFTELPFKFLLSYLLSNSCLMLFSALSLCGKPEFLELERSSVPF